jgi:hypothetical protein
VTADLEVVRLDLRKRGRHLLEQASPALADLGFALREKDLIGHVDDEAIAALLNQDVAARNFRLQRRREVRLGALELGERLLLFGEYIRFLRSRSSCC